MVKCKEEQMGSSSTTVESLRHENSRLFGLATTLWQLGDWDGLIEMPMDEVRQDDRSDIILAYKASAYLQKGDKLLAQVVLEELSQGMPKGIISLFLSGVYNSLGKAEFLLDHNESAERYFVQAVKLGFPHVESQAFFQARQAEQLAQLGSTYEWKNSRKGGEIPTPRVIREIQLGSAWASNTVNTVIFRHHALLTVRGRQYTAFYTDVDKLCIAQRDLKTDDVEMHYLFGDYNLYDAHNSISLGVDRKGYLHIAYDHHGTRLKYRRSLQPYDIAGWSDELPMSGKNEDKVTYPAFILPKGDNSLLMLYRDGNWKKGEAHLKYYDEESLRWIDYSTPILSGAQQKPWTSNAYWNHPAISENGDIHLSFTWRTDYFSADKMVSNNNIDYCVSFDQGVSWHTSKGRPCKLPVTQVNSETIWPISPGSNLINQCSMALDSKGYPHIAFYADDEKGIPQYQHVWFDGQKWNHTYVSKRTDDFNLAGGGTLKIPISRPEIVIDKRDNVYIIHRGDDTQQKLSATYLKSPRYRFDRSSSFIIYDKNIGFSEPIIDRSRWESEEILSFFVQHAEQPNSDAIKQVSYSPAYIVDIAF